MLGLRIVKPAGETSEEGFSFLSDGINKEKTLFEIMGDVFEERERQFIEQYGPGLDHICFAVDDMDKACDSLMSAGVLFHIPPYTLEDYRLAWCKDPIGTEVEIIQLPDDFPVVDEIVGARGINARLSHVGILIDGDEMARRMENFYKQHFGMTEIMRSDPNRKDMNWVYLEDASGSNTFWLEVVGDGIFQEQKAFLEKHGPGINHLCLLVDDAFAARGWLKENGVKIETETYDDDVLRMFYVRDPTGVMIQLMQKLDY
jgi:catechol 2,3-dioxygenase-like lactoylglutathione lyase family enzyme